MSMASLNELIDRDHEWKLIFDKSARRLNLDKAEDRQKIAEIIDSSLSPENLHCDGEISQAEAMRKFRFLNKCAKALIAIDPTVTIHEYCE